MNFVIDTNVLISASLSTTSTSKRVIDHCLSKGKIVFSDSTFLELSSRITRTKFDKYTRLEKRKSFVDDLHQDENVIFCTPKESITDSIDIDDNQFLEVAVEVNADYLITGDKKHLLPLNPFRGIKIITAREFLTIMEIPEK